MWSRNGKQNCGLLEVSRHSRCLRHASVNSVHVLDHKIVLVVLLATRRSIFWRHKIRRQLGNLLIVERWKGPLILYRVLGASLHSQMTLVTAKSRLIDWWLLLQRAEIDITFMAWPSKSFVEKDHLEWKRYCLIKLERIQLLLFKMAWATGRVGHRL